MVEKLKQLQTYTIRDKMQTLFAKKKPKTIGLSYNADYNNYRVVIFDILIISHQPPLIIFMIISFIFI